MLKKEEVYVVLDKYKHYEKFNKIVYMFNVDYTLDFHGVGGIAVFDNCFLPDTETKTKVSLKELRNILAREYLKDGDVALFEDKGYKVLGRYKKYSDVFKDFVCDKIEGNSNTTTGFHNFIRYATEEEKQLLKPQESVIDKAISLLQHGLGLEYSHEVIQGLEELKNK